MQLSLILFEECCSSSVVKDVILRTFGNRLKPLTFLNSANVPRLCLHLFGRKTRTFKLVGHLSNPNLRSCMKLCRSHSSPSRHLMPSKRSIGCDLSIVHARRSAHFCYLHLRSIVCQLGISLSNLLLCAQHLLFVANAFSLSSNFNCQHLIAHQRVLVSTRLHQGLLRIFRRQVGFAHASVTRPSTTSQHSLELSPACALIACSAVSHYLSLRLLKVGKSFLAEVPFACKCCLIVSQCFCVFRVALLAYSRHINSSRRKFFKHQRLYALRCTAATSHWGTSYWRRGWGTSYRRNISTATWVCVWVCGSGWRWGCGNRCSKLFNPGGITFRSRCIGT